MAVSFDENAGLSAFDLSKHQQEDTLVSTTGQLRWTPVVDGESKGGYFTMNTPGTKAFVGFAPGGQEFDLGDGYRITPDKGFAVIYLSAKGEKETLASASEIVVTVMARTRNTGMEFNAEGNRIVKQGKSPLRMEPVVAELTLPFAGSLDVLDHDGRAASSTRNFDGLLLLDGRNDQTPFYLIRK